MQQKAAIPAHLREFTLKEAGAEERDNAAAKEEETVATMHKTAPKIDKEWKEPITYAQSNG